MLARAGRTLPIIGVVPSQLLPQALKIGVHARICDSGRVEIYANSRYSCLFNDNLLQTGSASPGHLLKAVGSCAVHGKMALLHGHATCDVRRVNCDWKLPSQRLSIKERKIRLRLRPLGE